MQVDCYKRNFRTEVCTPKCPFYHECSRCYFKEATRNAKKRLRDRPRSDVRSV